MARFISQTLIRTTTITSSSPNSLQTIKFGLPQHHRFSSQSGKARLIEVDLESDSEVEVLGLRKLEDAIHSIIVRQSAPDWLPFVPGSSYWVPPRRHRYDSHGMVNLLRKFSKPLTDEESMSVSSSRGWPSSNYFIEGVHGQFPDVMMTQTRFQLANRIHIGTSTMHPAPMEMEAEVVHSNEENTPDAENEEG